MSSLTSDRRGRRPGRSVAGWVACIAVLLAVSCSSDDPSVDVDLESPTSDGPQLEGAFEIRTTAAVEGVPEGSVLQRLRIADAGPDCAVQGQLGAPGRGRTACAAGRPATGLAFSFPRGDLIPPGCEEATWSVEIVNVTLEPTTADEERHPGQLSFVNELLGACDGLVREGLDRLRAPATFVDDPLDIELVPAD